MENDQINPGQIPSHKLPSNTQKNNSPKSLKDQNLPVASEADNERQSPQGEGNGEKAPKKHRFFTRDPGIFYVTLITMIIIFFYTLFAHEQSIETGNAAKAAKESADAANAAVKLQKESVEKTLLEMKAQSQAMQDAADAARSQSESNRKSAKIAEDTLKANIEMSRRDLRAWVGPINSTRPTLQDGNRRVYVKDGEKVKLGVIITNSGKTPARRCKPHQRIQTFQRGTPFVPDYSHPVKTSISVVQPGMKAILYVTYDGPVTKDIIEQLRKGELILYLYGMITYEDIFGGEHKTTFCWYMDSDLSDMNSCDTHNEAD